MAKMSYRRFEEIFSAALEFFCVQKMSNRFAIMVRVIDNKYEDASDKERVNKLIGRTIGKAVKLKLSSEYDITDSWCEIGSVDKSVDDAEDIALERMGVLIYSTIAYHHYWREYDKLWDAPPDEEKEK